MFVHAFALILSPHPFPTISRSNKGGLEQAVNSCNCLSRPLRWVRVMLELLPPPAPPPTLPARWGPFVNPATDKTGSPPCGQGSIGCATKIRASSLQHEEEARGHQHARYPPTRGEGAATATAAGGGGRGGAAVATAGATEATLSASSPSGRRSAGSGQHTSSPGEHATPSSSSSSFFSDPREQQHNYRKR